MGTKPTMEDIIEMLSGLKGESHIIDRAIVEIERHLYVIEQELLRLWEETHAQTT